MSAGEVMKTEERLIFHTYPLCKHSDMPEEIKQEAIEMCVTATEKYTDNYESAARAIKDGLDKRFGGPFHVIVGESYACAVTYQAKSLLYMYNGGNIAVLVWRTVSSF
ncbi:PREDICTED: dynein light chain 4, axonemal-like [Dufourea novaeangliae]|uniref:Dynein light chain n=1 Tax=Dufourea novaeangliae TaxID=178035 RepID=A0A154P3P2_DUFNO|nr:PREDICTED: dynein light chain 4, axonemal-like [Dufourea novaeangliae]KZC06491.1 Dynein light chain 4, axonemal [Dufourea novaeangliae]